MNYYEILNVSQNATDKQIKSSYKKLVKKYHPDLYVGDKEFAEKKIKEINEAYDILSNIELKQEYDSYLNAKNYAKETYINSENISKSDEKNYESNFNKYILEKLNKLDSKKQFQIIFIAIFIILILFIINIFELKYYLTNNSTDNKTNITENSETFYNTTYPDNSFTNEYNELKTLDDLLYELFAPSNFDFNYQNKVKNEYEF